MFAYLNGRSSRREYWIAIVLLLVVGLGLAWADIPGASSAITFLWILVWNRRLHDIGRSGWLILIPFGLLIVCAAAGLLFGGQDIRNAFEYSQRGSGPVTDRGATMFVGLVLGLLAIQFGFTIWLGVKKGDPGSNRFGPVPTSL